MNAKKGDEQDQDGSFIVKKPPPFGESSMNYKLLFLSENILTTPLKSKGAGKNPFTLGSQAPPAESNSVTL